jgi:hypothetical protein
VKQKSDRGKRVDKRDWPTWSMKPGAPVSIIAPDGIEGVHFEEDPAKVGKLAAGAGRVMNWLLARAVVAQRQQPPRKPKGRLPERNAEWHRITKRCDPNLRSLRIRLTYAVGAPWSPITRVVASTPGWPTRSIRS